MQHVRRKFEERIKKKKEDIGRLERELAEARSYVQAMEDSLRMLPKAQSANQAASSLRPNSDLAKAYEALKAAGKPLHVAELAKRMGKEPTKGNKVSLSGSLSGYVRRSVIFTRPAPNTFGLIDAAGVSDEPPEEFGDAIEIQNGTAGHK